jgi:hypothetical protein
MSPYDSSRLIANGSFPGLRRAKQLEKGESERETSGVRNRRGNSQNHDEQDCCNDCEYKDEWPIIRLLWRRVELTFLLPVGWKRVVHDPVGARSGSMNRADSREKEALTWRMYQRNTVRGTLECRSVHRDRTLEPRG